MLGKVHETTCRLNVYLVRPAGGTRSLPIEAWGFGQISGRKCLVVQDAVTRSLLVLGEVRHRSSIPKEDMGLMARARMVEEGLDAADRAEWIFLVDEIDEKIKREILHGPLIEPGALVGEGLHL